MGARGLSLRPAGPADEEWLYRLHRATLHDVVVAAFGGWDESDQRARFAQRSPTVERYVVLSGDEPVGTLHLDRSGAGEVFLALVEVAPERQGQGLGSALVRGVVARAAEEGRGVRLQVLHANPRARALYRRLGFTETGRDEVRCSMRTGQSSARTTSA